VQGRHEAWWAVVGLLILLRTWRLLRDAVDVLLKATPKSVDPAEVRCQIVRAPRSATAMTCTCGPSPAA
jgi:Co/Zn/Cd efflux system component